MAKYDAILCLGGSVINAEPVEAVKRRVEKTFQYWKSQPEALVIFSGKQHVLNKQPDEATEAEAMKAYAIKLGLPERSIITENKSTTTLENAFYVKREVTDRKEWSSLLVVTSKHHLSRTKLLFKAIMGQSMNLYYDYPDNSNPTIKRKLIEVALTIATRILLIGVEPGNDSKAIRRLSRIYLVKKGAGDNSTKRNF